MALARRLQVRIWSPTAAGPTCAAASDADTAAAGVAASVVCSNQERMRRGPRVSISARALESLVENPQVLMRCPKANTFLILHDLGRCCVTLAALACICHD